jgi:hypothetical protein
MKKILMFAAIYAICGIYAYGTAMAELNWCKENDEYAWNALRLTSHDVVRICTLEGAIGPGGAIGMAIETNFNEHGWRLW